MPRHDHGIDWTECFPAFAQAVGGQRVRTIDDGWDCQVVTVASHAVRLPRRPDVSEQLRVEARTLPELAIWLPVAIPAPVGVCAQHGSLLYRWLDGDPLGVGAIAAVGPEVLGAQLAGLVTGIHAFSTNRARELGVPSRELSQSIEQFAGVVLPLVGPRRRAGRLLDHARALLVDHEWTFTHGDLLPAHLLCGDAGLVGAIDWTDMAIGDPAIDLAWMLNAFDQQLRDVVLDRYAPSEDVVARADVIHRLVPWWEALYGVERQRPDLVHSGIEGVVARLST